MSESRTPASSCCSLALATAWNDFSAIHSSDVTIVIPAQHCGSCCQCCEYVNILLEIISNSIIPERYTCENAIPSVAAFHFYKSFLSLHPETAFSEHLRSLVLKSSVLKCFEAVKYRSNRSPEDPAALIYSLTFISQLLVEQIDSFSMDYVLCELHKIWMCFEKLVTTTYEQVICFQSGTATDQQLTFLYESFRVWRLALKLYVRLNQTHCLYQETEAFSILLRVLYTCLVQYPELIGNGSSDGKVVLHPTPTYLLIRSLAVMCKFILHNNWLLPLYSSLEEIFLRVICGGSESSPLSMNGEHKVGALVAGLARWESEICPERKLQRVLFDPDPGISLRLIIVATLRLQIKNGDFNERSVHLLQSLRTIVLATRNSSTHSSCMYEESLVALLSEDDTHLFSALYLFLKLEECARKTELCRESYLQFFPDAHGLFACLVQSIDCSPHAILDWLISPETDCLPYLTHYLRLFRRHDISGFLEHADSRVPPRWLSIHWPRDTIKSMLNKLATSLTKLHSHGNVPFNPSPLIRSLGHATRLL